MLGQKTFFSQVKTSWDTSNNVCRSLVIVSCVIQTQWTVFCFLHHWLFNINTDSYSYWYQLHKECRLRKEGSLRKILLSEFSAVLTFVVLLDLSDMSVGPLLSSFCHSNITLLQTEQFLDFNVSLKFGYPGLEFSWFTSAPPGKYWGNILT
jgi:hypothetical protein